MRRASSKAFFVSVALCVVPLSADNVSAQTSPAEDRYLGALVERSLAKVRPLSDAEFEIVADRSRAITDANFNKLSKKDIRRLAKLGDAVWLDCSNFTKLGYEEKKATGLSDDMALAQLHTYRISSVFYDHMREKLSGHEKYETRSSGSNERSCQEGTECLGPSAGAGSFNCLTALFDTRLSGSFDNAAFFRGQSTKSDVLYKVSEAK
jgi:hypothetical protein